MKKVLIILIGLFFSLLTVSCSKKDKDVFEKLYRGESEIAKETLDKLIVAMENKDSTALKELFSKNTIETVENWDESVQELFEYYNGEFVSNSNSMPDSSEEFGYSSMKKEIYPSFDVETTEDTYRIYFYEVIVDTTYADNLGIKSFYIIRVDDDIDPNYGYGGDMKDTPGINVGIQNAWAEKMKNEEAEAESDE